MVYTHTRMNHTQMGRVPPLLDKMKWNQIPYDSLVVMGSGLPLKKSQESIFHSSQRDRTEPTE